MSISSLFSAAGGYVGLCEDSREQIAVGSHLINMVMDISHWYPNQGLVDDMVKKNHIILKLSIP